MIPKSLINPTVQAAWRQLNALCADLGKEVNISPDVQHEEAIKVLKDLLIATITSIDLDYEIDHYNHTYAGGDAAAIKATLELYVKLTEYEETL